MKTMHLFAGGGGGMYADLILGHTPTVAVEWEKAACDVLRARKAEWWPDCEIIEGDIRAFSGVRYAGEVDCIHAGFPCPTFSHAGKGAGLEDDRGTLYREAFRIAGEVRPRYLLLENVPGILTAQSGYAFARIMADLAEIGFDSIRWGCLSASEVGANHRRNRWWCLASNSDLAGAEPGTSCEVRSGGGGTLRNIDRHSKERIQGGELLRGSGGCGANVADTEAQRRNKGGLSERKTAQVSDAENYGPDVPHAQSQRCREARGDRSNESEERITSSGGSECYWSTEPPVGRVANGVAQRVNRLKMLGNGQVPLQAAYAWVMLGGPTEVL